MKNNVITARGYVENGAIVIPKVGLPENLPVNVILQLDSHLDVYIFADEVPNDDVCEQYEDCDDCQYFGDCKLLGDDFDE